jgi:hypothetical protein
MKGKNEGPTLIQGHLTQWFADKRHGWAVGDQDGKCYVVRKSDGCLPEIVNGVIFRRATSLKEDPKPADVIVFEAEKTAEGNLRAKQWCRKRDYDAAQDLVKKQKDQADKKARQATLPFFSPT